MVGMEEDQKQIIGRVGQPMGSNQFTVDVPDNLINKSSEDSTYTQVLVQLGRSMTSSKKTKTWVKRGSLCYLEPYNDDKIKVWGEMVSILSANDEKALKKSNNWPKAFTQTPPQSQNTQENVENDGDDDLFVNPNRRTVVEESDDSEEEESD
ncbi:hypothetical protein E3Q09_03452 [Wallemia mellicola]|nr:hypothetical protein E3Q09_03452 [Wallemia mellicola]